MRDAIDTGIIKDSSREGSGMALLLLLLLLLELIVVSKSMSSEVYADKESVFSSLRPGCCMFNGDDNRDVNREPRCCCCCCCCCCKDSLVVTDFGVGVGAIPKGVVENAFPVSDNDEIRATSNMSAAKLVLVFMRLRRIAMCVCVCGCLCVRLFCFVCLRIFFYRRNTVLL